ncbi:MAG: hypothetical protein IID43_01115 [Planctomycetes bacterium]|nr:hypothetical protein [Planctomycetota bacterium]
MQTVVLFEDESYAQLLPLVYWRTVFELHIGHRIILDRTAQCLALPVSGVWTREWLAAVAAHRCGAPVNQAIDESTILVNGRWIFDGAVKFPPPPAIGVIGDEIAYVVCDTILSSKLSAATMLDPSKRCDAVSGVVTVEAPGWLAGYPWDFVGKLAELLNSDWSPEHASIDVKLDPRVVLDGIEQIHIGHDARIHPTAVIDAGAGPVFLSHNVTVGAHSVIEGPIYIGPGTQINPHAWLHGGNAIGPVCKLGGEVDGCIISGYTNKPHAGFLGHSYVGSWVNIGAGATNSNLKNTYGPVRVRVNNVEVDTGRTFFGAIIADHAKIGINATIPTGGVVGFAANVLSSRPAPKFVPSFGWWTDDGLAKGDPARLLDVATRVMARRDIDMTDAEVDLFFDLESRARTLEARRNDDPQP